MHLTSKQIELLTIIRDANPDGKPVDLDQLIERASYRPSKQSIQFSIRALIGHDLIEKSGAENRRGRQRVLFGIKPLGLHFIGHARSASFVSSVAEDDDLSVLEELLR